MQDGHLFERDSRQKFADFYESHNASAPAPTGVFEVGLCAMPAERFERIYKPRDTPLSDVYPVPVAKPAKPTPKQERLEACVRNMQAIDDLDATLRALQDTAPSNTALHPLLDSVW